MSQKDFILKKREEERIKKQTEQLSKKLINMTPQQRSAFFDDLTNKLNKINKQLNDLEFDIRKNNKIVKKREFSVLGETLTIMVPFTVSSFLAGAGIFKLLKVSDAFFIAFISSASSLLSSVILSSALSIIACSAVGIGIGVLTDISLQNKVVSNFINKIKIKIDQSKIKKLQNGKNEILIKLNTIEDIKQ